jgi:hypothetical protein
MWFRNMSEKMIIEWAPFTLAEGVEESSLLAASDDLQDGFLAKQKGFVRRELLKGPNGQWVDLVVWEDRDAAKEAVRNAAESPACFRYFQLMEGAHHDEPGAGIMHLEQRRAYAR